MFYECLIYLKAQTDENRVNRFHVGKHCGKCIHGGYVEQNGQLKMQIIHTSAINASCWDKWKFFVVYRMNIHGRIQFCVRKWG